MAVLYVLKQCRADNSRVIAKLSYTKLGSGNHSAAVLLLANDRKQGVDKRLTLTRYTAAEGNYLRLEYVYDGGKS